MNVICVDDEELALKYIESQLKKIDRVKKITTFRFPEDAMTFLESNKVDVCFLDIEMYMDNGVDIAKKIKALYPHVYIIFVTAYPQYAINAFKIKVQGYLLKPVLLSDLQYELDNLSVVLKKQENKRVRVQTFGNFEIFCDEEPLKFQRKKSKELFAYLVFRNGTTVDIGELITNLWESYEVNDLGRSMIHNVISDLSKTLKEHKIDDIFIKSRNSYRIDPSKIDCDYYRFLAGDIQAINSFSGEFMENYNWAMFTSSYLQEKAKNE